MAELSEQQVPGVYHRRVGDMLVTALSDGFLDAPFSCMTNIEEGEADQLLQSSFRASPPRISINCYLLRVNGRTALVDTGAANSMGETLGRLAESLAAVNVSPSDIDTVLLTHMHPDHSNWLTTPDGQKVFPNAQIALSEIEMRHWHDDAEMARADDVKKERYFRAARFQLAPYRDQLIMASKEVFPGVEAMPAPGHTPGHVVYVVTSANESMIIWGDVCHFPDIQISHPEVSVTFDSDSNVAIATRKRILDQVSEDKMLIAGMHAHFPGFIRVVRQNGLYVPIIEGWQHEL